MSKASKSAGFYMITFDDGSVEIFKSRKAVKNALSGDHEKGSSLPEYLYGPITHIKIQQERLVNWDIIEKGKSYNEEDLVNESAAVMVHK
jgi:hypothetical protein